MDIKEVTDLLIEHEGYCTIPSKCAECSYDIICDMVRDKLHDHDMKSSRYKSAQVIKDNNYDIDFLIFEHLL